MSRLYGVESPLRSTVRREKGRSLATREHIYRFVAAYIREHERAPTYREISAAVGIVWSACYRQVHILVDEGKLEVATIQGKRVARGITLPRTPLAGDELHDLCWQVVDAWDDGNLGDAIRQLHVYLIDVAPR